MEVGILFKGNSLIEPIQGIELKRCITWKQLHKYKIRLIENIKKDDIEQVKQLPIEGTTYSIGACDIAIKNITIYVKSLEEILGEKDAVLKEKEKSIKALKETTEANVQLQNQSLEKDQVIANLRDKVKDLKLEVDSKDAQITQLTKDKTALTDKLNAEINLRKEKEQKLQTYQDSLGQALEETQDQVTVVKQQMNEQFNNEINEIKKVIIEKDTKIKDLSQRIEELNEINETLSKAGSIPDIYYEHKANSKIVGFCGQGSYGVSSILYTTYKILCSQYNCLIVDLDFKGGNLGKYIKSDNKVIENVLKGGDIYPEFILKTISGRSSAYIGGVESKWEPSKIVSLPFIKIFEGEWDYILVDCGIYNKGYDIQTKICENIIKNGQMFFVYKDEEQKKSDCINIYNFSSDMRGIPFISSIMVNNISLYDNEITKNKVHLEVVNKINGIKG